MKYVAGSGNNKMKKKLAFQPAKRSGYLCIIKVHFESSAQHFEYVKQRERKGECGKERERETIDSASNAIMMWILLYLS